MVNNTVFPILIYVGSYMALTDDTITGNGMFIAVFAIFSAALSMGQMTVFGPDVAKGSASG